MQLLWCLALFGLTAVVFMTPVSGDKHGVDEEDKLCVDQQGEHDDDENDEQGDSDETENTMKETVEHTEQDADSLEYRKGSLCGYCSYCQVEKTRYQNSFTLP